MHQDITFKTYIKETRKKFENEGIILANIGSNIFGRLMGEKGEKSMRLKRND